MTEQEIRDLFKSQGVPLSQDDVWTVQKAQVVKHKALERLAATLKIKYAAPQVLRAERDEAVILVTGTLGDMTEWSVGEAIVVPMQDSGKTNNWGKPIMEPVDGAMGNYQVSPKQASYVWAMAEKRAKDRVILKLAGLHGAYSEDEADDFKQQPAAAAPAPATVLRPEPVGDADESKTKYIAACKEIIRTHAGDYKHLVTWWKEESQKRRDFDLNQSDVDDLKADLQARQPKAA